MYCLLMVWLEQQEDMVPSHLHAFDPSSQQLCNCATVNTENVLTYDPQLRAVLSFVCKSVWVCYGHCHVVDKTSVCASVGISALCPRTHNHVRAFHHGVVGIKICGSRHITATISTSVTTIIVSKMAVVVS